MRVIDYLVLELFGSRCFVVWLNIRIAFLSFLICISETLFEEEYDESKGRKRSL